MFAVITTIFALILDWLTDLAKWIVMPDNQIYFFGIAIGLATTIFGIFRRMVRGRG